jgi:uncharacterized membrane protein
MPCVSLTVQIPQPIISITNITVSKSTVAPGDTISVTVTFSNTGNADGSATWALTWDGAVQGSYITSPTVKAGGTATQTVSFTVPSTATAGAHSLCAEIVPAYY